MTLPVSTSSYFTFYSLKLIDRVNMLLRDLQTYTFENTLCDHLHEKALTLALKSTLNDCIHMQLYPEEITALRSLALELKRKDFRRNVIWNSLPTNIQLFVSQLDPLTEDPTKQKTDFSSSYTVPNFADYVNADFGDGRLFKVSNLINNNESISLDLVNFPGLKITRYKSEISKKKAVAKAARHTQLTIFQLPSIPFHAIGSIFISDNATVIPLSQISFNAVNPSAILQMARDIHAFMVTERIWNINLLGSASESDKFAAYNYRIVTPKEISSATVLTEDVKTRHQTICDKLPADPTLLRELQTLNATLLPKEVEVAKELELLKSFGCEPRDIAKGIEQCLVLKALLKYLSKQNGILELLYAYRQLGVTSFHLLQEYARLAIKETVSVSKSWQDICEQQIHNDQRFYNLLICHLCEQFEIKASLQEQVDHLMDSTKNILTDLLKGLNISPSSQTNHFKSTEELFWARVGNQSGEILASILNQALDEKNLFQDRLVLIRYASTHLESEKILNQALSTTIADQEPNQKAWELANLTLLAQTKARHEGKLGNFTSKV